jgi:hypothetical protein
MPYKFCMPFNRKPCKLRIATTRMTDVVTTRNKVAEELHSRPRNPDEEAQTEEKGHSEILGPAR